MKALLLFLFTLFAIHVSAQQRLYFPRVDDNLKKQQVTFKDLGRTGRDVLWDMSDVNLIDNAGAFSYQDNDDSGEEYAYDKNGNLVKNLDRNISSIQYNTLNLQTKICDTRRYSALSKQDLALHSLARALPTRITTKDQNTYEAEYTYDAQGRKLRATYQKKVMDIVAPARPLTKTLAMSSRFEGLGNSKVRPETIIQDTIIHGAPIGDYSEFSQTDYCGNIIYRGNRATVLNAHGYTNIDTDAATGESTATHYYYLKDHLGNNRVVFRDDGLVVQENHYYAYGNLTADCYGSDAQQYKYNGKELDRKLGIDLYDYGARWYDATGRLGFTTIDPLCEEDYSVSPYVYCRDNPINAIDPDGKAVKIWYKDKNGNYQTFYFDGTQNRCPDNSYVKDFIKAYEYLINHNTGHNIQKAVNNSQYSILLKSDKESFFSVNKGKAIVHWNSRSAIKTNDGSFISPATILEHEFDHAIDWVDNPTMHDKRTSQKVSKNMNAEEQRVLMGSEAETARKLGERGRTFHTGTSYNVASPESTTPQRLPEFNSSLLNDIYKFNHIEINDKTRVAFPFF